MDKIKRALLEKMGEDEPNAYWYLEDFINHGWLIYKVHLHHLQYIKGHIVALIHHNYVSEQLKDSICLTSQISSPKDIHKIGYRIREITDFKTLKATTTNNELKEKLEDLERQYNNEYNRGIIPLEDLVCL